MDSRKIAKSALSVVLALALVVTGITFFPRETMETVQATGDAAASYVWESVTYETKYAETAPVCGTEGYFFGGFYEEVETVMTPVENPAEGTTYQAKFVPADVLSVKCQVATGTNANTETTALRILTTADCFDYDEIGFDITFGTKTVSVQMDEVLDVIPVNTGIEAYTCSPNLFSLASNYFASVVIGNIPSTAYAEGFLIEPYWITANGTKVTGISRYMHIEDSYTGNGYINVPVYLNDDVEIGAGTTITINRKHYAGATSVAGNSSFWPYVDYEVGSLFTADELLIEGTDVNSGAITITVKDTVTETKKANGLLVNLRLKARYSLKELQSRNLFEMTGTTGTESVNVLDVLYRNLSAVGGSDRTWYNTTDRVFVIATAEELMGLEEVTKTYADLAGCTVKIVADLDLNSTWTANSTAPKNVWKPCSSLTGSIKTGFAGTLDGQNHTIRGLYTNVADTYSNVGLFGTLAGTVKNLTLDNCYFNGGTLAHAGAVAGTSAGTIENVKVQNSVVEGTKYTGGIVGKLDTNATISTTYCDATVTGHTTNSVGTGGIAGYAKDIDNVQISNCWYAGTLSGGRYVGGIVGTVQTSTVTISHCQNTGNVVVTATSGTPEIGGFIGFIGAGSSANRTITIEDSVNLSKLTTTANTMLQGSIFGQIYGDNDNVVINKTYGVSLFRINNANEASGWPRTGYNFTNGGKVTIDGTVIAKGYTSANYLSELDMRFARLPGQDNGTLPLTFGDGDDCYWVLNGGGYGGEPRLKSFVNMTFKRAGLEQ